MDQQDLLQSYKTVREAAALLEITRQAVVKAIKNGHIIAERKGGMYLISVEQLEAYRLNPLRNPKLRGARGGRPKQT